MEEALEKLIQELGQSKLNLMGSEGYFILGFLNGRQIAFRGPYLSSSDLKRGWSIIKRQALNPRPNKWFAVEVKEIKEA